MYEDDAVPEIRTTAAQLRASPTPYILEWDEVRQKLEAAKAAILAHLLEFANEGTEWRLKRYWD